MSARAGLLAWVALLSLTAPACSALFQATDDDAGCARKELIADSMADTNIVGSSPERNLGSEPLANVGVDIDSVGLFKFDVTLLPSNAQLRAARVVLSPAATSGACGGAACADCNWIEADGTLALFTMRSDWSETEATWVKRTADASWTSEGANEPDEDHSSGAVAVVQHVAGAAESFEIETDALADVQTRWRDGNMLSFWLYPSAGAVMLIATRESADESCVSDGYPRPQLEVSYCR